MSSRSSMAGRWIRLSLTASTPRRSGARSATSSTCHSISAESRMHAAADAGLAGVSFVDGVQDRLHVEDRRSVESLKVTYKDPQTLDGEDLDTVQADRVRPVG